MPVNAALLSVVASVIMLACALGPDAETATVEPYVALPGDETPVDFFREIQPILGDYCVRCHGGVRELGSLNLLRREDAARVLGHPGNPNSSRLWQRVTSDTHGARMPIGQQPLSTELLVRLRRWLYQGAPWPQQWSFAPILPLDPQSVPVSNEAWVATPVDRFILRRLDEAGIAPSPQASKETLIRRVSLDVTGLPPTPAEVDAFLADASANAYELVVDRLLASPAFGERWARHWLDQARYADSDGYEKDNGRPTAWRYRDWVVDSINRDQPFDEFTTEQLAGDLVPGANAMQGLATGFSRNTLRNLEDGVDVEEDRTKRIVDRAATVGTAWLGLTLGCSQCHSHPYDAISQKEFYRLYSFFDNADETTLDVPTSASNLAAGTTQVDVLRERTSERRKTYLLERGDFLSPDKAEVLKGGTPRILPPLQPRGGEPDRLDLARWLVRADNPLTPRVAVNTVWYHLFGYGLVTTLEDFGARASYPSHPQLLDWLAANFVSTGFSRKKLLKQLLLSATYRQASAFRADVPIDAENTLLYRQNRVRVEAEIVVDGVLAVSGLLSRKLGGPSVYPPMPPELIGLSYDGIEWPTSSGEDAHRRGIYTWHQRTQLYPSLAGFDRPSATVSVTGRPRSSTPLQPLITLHDPVFVEAAQAFARRVQQEVPGALEAQLVHAYRLALARAPSAAEIAELGKLHSDAQTSFRAAPHEATAVVGAFQPAGIDVGSAAAWVSVARVILNLDEFVTRE
jgi:hypothetical protein